MEKYIIFVKHIQTQIVAVQAFSEEEAKEIVLKGNGEYLETTEENKIEIAKLPQSGAV